MLNVPSGDAGVIRLVVWGWGVIEAAVNCSLLKRRLTVTLTVDTADTHMPEMLKLLI